MSSWIIGEESTNLESYYPNGFPHPWGQWIGKWELGWFGQEDPQNLRISMTQIVRDLQLPNVDISNPKKEGSQWPI